MGKILDRLEDGTVIYGPYLSSTIDRQQVVINRPDGTVTSKTYSRWLYEREHGEINNPNLHVDHINEDPHDDRLENLQLLAAHENIKKSARQPELYEFICPQCGMPSVRLAREVRHAQKQGKAGPFCGKSCAGKWSTQR